jgi:Response regulator containing CheY-like receiver, AAA-type ATPase, and DNA-binding domains
MQNNKILVVDDDSVSRMVLSKILAAHSYRYQVVGSAIEAFEALSDRSFSLILMDIEMPEVDGLEAARFIRGLNSDQFRNMPIIALTAHRREDVLGQASESGMDEVVSKPIDIQKLISAITSALRTIHTS